MWSESVGIEGLEFDYNLYGTVIRAKVAVYEPGMGLTVQSVEGGQYLLCVRGPDSPHWRDDWSGMEEGLARVVEALLDKIVVGRALSAEEVDAAVSGEFGDRVDMHVDKLSAESCAFSQ